MLADQAGLYHTTISELELGVTIPGLVTLSKIAKALGVDLAELIQPTDSDPDPSPSGK